MKPYANLDDFGVVMSHLMHDPHVEPLPMTLAEETACLSLLLRVYILPELTDDAIGLVLDLARKFSDDIIRRYPFAEGYVDYLFGAAMMERGDLFS